MPTDGMEPHIERAIEAFNDHDAERLLDQMTADATFTDPLEADITGDELHEYTVEIFEAFPDLRLEVDRVISGDGVVALECRYVGTHEGLLDDLPPTGNAVVVPSMTVIDVFEDGITSWRDYWDQQTFSEQLGLEFPEILPLVPRMLARKVESSL